MRDAKKKSNLFTGVHDAGTDPSCTLLRRMAHCCLFEQFENAKMYKPNDKKNILKNCKKMQENSNFISSPEWVKNAGNAKKKQKK